jgi:macrodomain Ter protein organizer (MatP/YcbG family)
LRKIENYRRKEKSIGVPIIIDEANFFSLNAIERQEFLTNTILTKIDLLREKVKRNKLDLDVSKLKEDIARLLAD